MTAGALAAPSHHVLVRVGVTGWLSGEAQVEMEFNVQGIYYGRRGRKQDWVGRVKCDSGRPLYPSVSQSIIGYGPPHWGHGHGQAVLEETGS